MVTTDLLAVTLGLVARAQRITTANGYHTNAGLNVHNGRRDFSRAEAYPLASVIPGPERPERVTLTGSGDDGTSSLYLITCDFDVVGVIDTPSDDLATNPIALRQDLKRALLLGGDDLACLLNDIELAGSDEADAAEDETDSQVVVSLRLSWHELLPGA